MSEVQCPRCGNSVSELQVLDSALIGKLRESGGGEDLPPQVCMNCFSELAGSAARGSVLHAREKAKEQKKLMLWKSRVNLIKRARQMMNEKQFSDAAVQYEKYVKVLEIIFDCEPGALSPEHFKNSARTQELTVVAGVFWDLMRIYDTSEKYGDRMQMTAKKLAQFLRYTPVYPDIIRKAEVFVKTSKNPAIIKSFLKSAAESKGRCFIATAAFESYAAPEVLWLQDWRDQQLLPSFAGRVFVTAYYKMSPAFAAILDRVPPAKPFVRALLRCFIAVIRSVRAKTP